MAHAAPVPPLSTASLVADVVVFTIDDGRLKVLIVDKAGDPFDGYAVLPGVFVWNGETTRDSALRALHAKAGVTEVYVEQLYTFDSLTRDPRGHVVSVAHYALVPKDRLAPLENAETRNPRLMPVDHLPPLGFDHAEIVAYALDRLRSKVGYSNAMYSLLPPQFTLAQLQGAYEAVLGIRLDKRNFLRKYAGLGLIEETDVRLEGMRHRPARLFRFIKRQQVELPAPFL